MLHFEPVDPDNWRTRLTIREDQKCFVAQPEVIMARAWAYREQRSQVMYVWICRNATAMCCPSC